VGTNTCNVKILLMETMAGPFGALAEILDEEDQADWNIRSMQLDITTTAGAGVTPELYLRRNNLAYQGRTACQTSVFVRLLSHTGNLTLNVFGADFDGSETGPWIHRAMQHTGAGPDAISAIGSGTVSVQLALPYRGSGWHAGAPVFDFGG